MRLPPPVVSAKMKRQRRRDTPCEMHIRRRLHALGLRYRVDAYPELCIRRKADMVFPSEKVAIFVDGCFWHVCPLHASWPKGNGEWWREKLLRNQARDAETTSVFQAKGWTVLRFWEHDDADDAARRIASIVLSKRR